MLIRGINITTGKTFERPYTQKELDNVAVMTIESANQKAVKDKEIDIANKRGAAVEEILLGGTSVKAKAYQDAIK